MLVRPVEVIIRLQAINHQREDVNDERRDIRIRETPDKTGNRIVENRLLFDCVGADVERRLGAGGFAVQKAGIRHHGQKPRKHLGYGHQTPPLTKTVR